MSTKLNIKTISEIDPASEQVTPCFRLLRGEVKPFNGRHNPARRTLPRWERLDHSGRRKWKYVLVKFFRTP